MIQQTIPVQLIVKGDGTSTAFSFDLSTVFGLYFDPNDPSGSSSPGAVNPFTVLNPSSIPDAVSVDATIPNQGTVTATLSKRTVTINFPAGFTGNVTVALELLFNG